MRNCIYKRLGPLKRLGLFCVVMFSSAALYAQVKISGKVTNEKGDGISGVSVIVKSDNVGSSTNTEGIYQVIANLKSGKKTVQFSAIGYKSIDQTINVAVSGDYTLNAQLVS